MSWLPQAVGRLLAVEVTIKDRLTVWIKDPLEPVITSE
jgi:hypothetical protein